MIRRRRSQSSPLYNVRVRSSDRRLVIAALVLALVLPVPVRALIVFAHDAYVTSADFRCGEDAAVDPRFNVDMAYKSAAMTRCNLMGDKLWFSRRAWVIVAPAPSLVAPMAAEQLGSEWAWWLAAGLPITALLAFRRLRAR